MVWPCMLHVAWLGEAEARSGSDLQTAETCAAIALAHFCVWSVQSSTSHSIPPNTLPTYVQQQSVRPCRWDVMEEDMGEWPRCESQLDEYVDEAKQWSGLLQEQSGLNEPDAKERQIDRQVLSLDTGWVLVISASAGEWVLIARTVQIRKSCEMIESISDSSLQIKWAVVGE